MTVQGGRDRGEAEGQMWTQKTRGRCGDGGSGDGEDRCCHQGLLLPEEDVLVGRSCLEETREWRGPGAEVKAGPPPGDAGPPRATRASAQLLGPLPREGTRVGPGQSFAK